MARWTWAQPLSLRPRSFLLKRGAVPPGTASPSVLWAGVALASLLGIAGALGSEVTVTTVSPPREVSARAVTTLAFRVTNVGASADVYDLSLDVPVGFSVVTLPSPVGLGPAEARVVLVSVFVSPLARAGDHTLAFHARSQSVPSHTASSQARVIVLPWAAVEVRVPSGGTTWPGGKATYPVWVINRGNAVDTIRIELQAVWGTAQATPSVVHLLPNEAAEVTVTVSIPEGTKIGDKTYLTVTARSTADPTVYDSGGLWTAVTASPLGPGAPALSLFPTVGATLGWMGRLQNGDFTSFTSLSLGGPIGGGKYLALSGTLGVQTTGMWVERGWIEYREEEWTVRLGSIAFSGPAVDLAALGLRYTYHPRAWPLRMSIYYAFADSSVALETRLGAGERALELRVQASGDFSISAQFKTEASSVRLQAGSTTGVTVSTYGDMALSGHISWGPEFKLALSGESAPFSGRLAYNHRGGETQVLGALGYAPLALEALRFRAALESEWKKDEDPLSPLETLSLEARLTGSGRSGILSWSGGLRLHTSVDLLLGGSSLTSIAEGGMGVSPGGGLSLSLEAKLTHFGSGTTTDLALRAAGIILGKVQFELKWVLLGDEQFLVTMKGSGMSVRLLTKPGTLELGAEVSFRTLLPLIETLGRVEGVAFVDANRNGARDPGEEPVPGLMLQLGGVQATTDSEGVFRFPAMVPGTYELRSLTGVTLYCVQPPLPLVFPVAAGEVKSISLALVPVGKISGRVITVRRGTAASGTNGEWVPDRPVAGARVLAGSGETARTTITDSAGRFYFLGLCPGTWEVRVELPELAPPHALEQEVFVVELGPGEAAELEARAAPVPRPIRPPRE